MLIEKLSRSCPDISMIYVMIRSQKDKSPENLLDEMLEDPLYDRIKKEVPYFHKKIIPIIGDFNIKDFGLSESDRNMLIKKVNVIFHIAADMQFYENLKISTIVNNDATATIIKLAQDMSHHLKSFIHVSTIYSNCHVKHIEERIYSYPINHKHLITFARNLPENIFEEKISKFSSQWPNTYTFTKAISEGLFKNKHGRPFGIFRPAMVISSASEPLIGWIDNMYGPSDFARSLLLGIIRFHRCNGTYKANIVPVDFTVNALIASAWDVDQHGHTDNVLVYNFVPPVDGPTWNEYIHALLDINKIYPLRNAIYLPLMTLFKHKIPYRFCVWFGHFLPALLLDAASICIGRSPSMWKLYMKVDKFCKAIEPFCNTEWTYSIDNVQSMWDHLKKEDKQLFNFNMMEFNWTEYLINHYQGMRLYRLNENDSMLKVSRMKYTRFYWIHQIIKTIFFFIIFWIIWFMFREMFYVYYFSNLFIFCLVGGTGFLGKMLIEKLLRSCPDISMIYVMIRSQKDKSPENLLDEMLEDPVSNTLTISKHNIFVNHCYINLYNPQLYDRIKKEVPYFRKKIIPIIGDCNIKDLGLSESDRNMLINKVKIIFHIATNMQFYENLKISTIVNVDATATIIKLAQDMSHHLKSFIHVSTIYSNCHVKHIEERIYSYPINHKHLITFARNLPENIFEEKISKISSQWPNTYTFTKAISEGLFKSEDASRFGIFRPAMVISSASEPLIGWIDNMYSGLSGFARSLLLGIVRFHHCNGAYKANIVPVDFTVNALIASAYDVRSQYWYDQFYDLYYCNYKNMRNNEYIRINIMCSKKIVLKNKYIYYNTGCPEPTEYLGKYALLRKMFQTNIAMMYLMMLAV
ncbi:FACR1 reductase, partial [Acromyrmex insinuator]